MKILVTGGAGFIGSNLCEFFVKKGHEVTCLDNFATGRLENIKDLLDNFSDRFKLVVGDIRRLSDCREAVAGNECVFHEAALGSVPRSIKDPITTNEVNVGGFINMLVASCEAKVRRFVFAASSSAYGDSPELPKTEDNVGRQLSPYAVSKYVDELYAHAFSLNYGLEYIGLRYFNVFGPRQNPNGEYAAVIPIFIHKMLTRSALEVNGDGEFSRDFTYIDNILRINELALTTECPDAVNQIYNAACGKRTSLNQLINCLHEIIATDGNCQPVVVHGPKRKGDIPHSLASISKARRLLGYEPVCSFREGLARTCDWYASLL